MKRCWFKSTNFSLLMFAALMLSIAAFGVTPVSAFSAADFAITKTDGVATATPGGSVTYTVSATINASATGTLSNTATVTSGAVSDPNPANNSATDTDTLTAQADLAITKTDGVTTATPGGSVTYTITASNAGPSTASGATVADTFPAVLTGTWTCAGAGGGTCTASGSGNINDTVNLPAGGSVTYTVSATISGSATGTLSNTATVSSPAGVTDPTPGNNSATDTDTVACSAALTVTSNADSGAGSLRKTIADVCPDGTITFSDNYTIHLASELVIGKNLTIDGAGHSVTVSGNNATRVFYVNGGVTFNLQNLTVTGSNASGDYGGGISNKGSLAVSNCSFTGNIALYGSGIYNENTLTVTNSTFSGNSVSAYGGVGAGIHNTGTLTVTGCTFSGNSASAGGGMYNFATLTVTNSTFSGNSTEYNGAGIHSNATLTVTNCTFSGNSSLYGSGGGISNMNGTLTVTGSTISGNSARFGGGIATSDGALTVRGSTISGNSSQAGNGGGIYNEGMMTQGTLNYFNTIIANSSSGGDCVNVNNAAVGINKNNLVEDGSCSANGVNFLTGDPLLGALGSYGGATQTLPLLPGSLAIDADDPDNCTATDQRGVARPQGSACDIGAFESQGFTLAKTGGDGQSTPINTLFTNPLALSVTSAFGEPVNGGAVTFTPPASGASAAITGSPATISGGAASVTATANGTAGGPYNVTASAAGAASVDFSLTNSALSTTTTSVSSTTTSVSSTTTSVSSTTTSVAPSTTTTTAAASTTTTTVPPSDTCLTVIPHKVFKLLYGAGQSRELSDHENGQEVDPQAIIAILRTLGFATPLQLFAFIGDKDTVFNRDDMPEWNTDSIQTLMKLKLRKRTMLALVFINPFTADEGTYTVTVGDCSGTVELLEP